MTFVEAAIELLKREGAPLPVEILAERAASEGLLSRPSKNPLSAMKGRLTTELKRGESARVVEVEEGVFALPGVVEEPEDVEEIEEPEDVEDTEEAEDVEDIEEPELTEAGEEPEAERTGRRRRRRRRRRRGGNGVTDAEPAELPEEIEDAEAD